MDWEWVLRREAPCVAYEVETEVRFWKAERPTPRRVDIFCEEVGGARLFVVPRERSRSIMSLDSQEKYIACIRDLCLLQESRLYIRNADLFFPLYSTITSSKRRETRQRCIKPFAIVDSKNNRVEDLMLITRHGLGGLPGEE